jgi:hypothetical protein
MTSAGMDCLTESLPDGYGKLITQPLGLEGDINDARAPNSTVLEWYYQLAARWVPKLECSEYPREDDDVDDTVSDNAPAKAAVSETAGTSAHGGTASAAHTAGTASATASTSGADSSASDAPTSSTTERRLRNKSKSRKNKVPSAVFPRPKAMSFHNYAGPGDLNRKQSSFVFTYQVGALVMLVCSLCVLRCILGSYRCFRAATHGATVSSVQRCADVCLSCGRFVLQSPTDAESIFWYTGRMHHSGTMLRLKQHAHNIIFRESIFFAASPEQLGLTKANKLMPDFPYNVVRTKEAGFGSNAEVKRFILETLERSKEQHSGTRPLFLTRFWAC